MADYAPPYTMADIRRAQLRLVQDDPIIAMLDHLLCLMDMAELFAQRKTLIQELHVERPATSLPLTESILDTAIKAVQVENGYGNLYQPEFARQVYALLRENGHV